MSTHIWLRAESKFAEERTALTPAEAGRLLAAGYRLTVEKSAQSAFPWREYQAVGCTIAGPHTWITDAPAEAIILGLKELEPGNTPLIHRHIHFAHVYKNQEGWENVLSRFVEGGGVLYDLEFLVDEKGHRVAAFGHWAGFAGAALAVEAWSRHARQIQPVLEPVTSAPDQQILIDKVRRMVEMTGLIPRALVIGALGRCGNGAVELLRAIGAEVIPWDLEQTIQGGPFDEILEADLFLNCVFVEKLLPPFLTLGQLQNEQRRLSVVCDVSCDPYGDYNPVPIYERCTTFSRPIDSIAAGVKPLYLIAIDHLPSLLPRESSEDFCQQLMPHLLQLDHLDQGVWRRAFELFQMKTSLIGTRF